MAAEIDVIHRAARLAGFLSENGKRAWEWGFVDCTMMAGDWVYAETGVDPARLYRGSYTTASECQALIKREGGYMPLIGMLMDQAGFERTQKPETGDVGIVEAPIALQCRAPVVGTVMAIRFKQFWVVRALCGLAYRELPTVTAWIVPECKTRS